MPDAAVPDQPIHRIACCAPACGRGIGVDAWRKRFGDLNIETAEYVCHRHWTMVPAAMRKVYARARRRERRMGVHLPSTSRLWSRIMRDVRASRMRDKEADGTAPLT